MKSGDNAISRFLNSGRAATTILVVLIAVCYFLGWLTRAPMFFEGFSIIGLTQPWGFLTYPFTTMLGGLALLWEALALLCLWQAGTYVEREIGALRLLIFFFASTAVGGLSLYVGASLAGDPLFAFNGPFLPVSAVMVAYARRIKDMEVMLAGGIPMSGLWLGIVVVIGDILMFGMGHPLVGAFVVVPCGLAWAYAGDALPGISYIPGTVSRIQKGRMYKASEKRSQAYYDDVYKREKERKDQERLRKLFEDSLSDDDKK